MKTVEILFFDACPNLDEAVRRARAAIVSTGVEAEVHLVPVEDDDQAVRRRFFGSPTVRVDGIDVEPGAATRTDYALQCRMYPGEGRLVGAPPIEWIVGALRGEAIG